MATYEQVDYTDDAGHPQTMYLRDPAVGSLAGRTVLYGDQVNEDGVPTAPAPHSSAVLLNPAAVTRRLLLLLDNERGLVVARQEGT